MGKSLFCEWIHLLLKEKKMGKVALFSAVGMTPNNRPIITVGQADGSSVSPVRLVEQQGSCPASRDLAGEMLRSAPSIGLRLGRDEP